MRVIEPITISYGAVASNVNETEHPQWAAATNYAVAARVIRDHKIYEAARANVGKDPLLDSTAVDWIYVSATNRWKPFDGKLSDQMVVILANQNAPPGAARYQITLSERVDTIAMFNLSASRLDINVRNPGIIWTRTYNLIETANVYDAWTYFFEPVVFKSELVIKDIPGNVGNQIWIDFRGSSTEVRVGEIILGRDHLIGQTLTGSQVGIQDFSIKERDDFGNFSVVERGFSSTVRFNFMFSTRDSRRLIELFGRIRAKAAVFYPGDGLEDYGMSIPGYYVDFNVPLTTNYSFGTLEVESLV